MRPNPGLAVAAAPAGLALAGLALAGLALAGCGTSVPGSAVGGATSPTTITTTAPATTSTAGNASFPGRWPVTTAAAAATLQQEVDGGHQPWLLDPAEVALSYASSQLGWAGAEVVSAAGGTVALRDAPTGRIATVTLNQPGRTGPTGIWVVTAST